MKQSHWTDNPLVGFDTETTGTNPKEARILQAAIVTRDPSGMFIEEDRVLYIDPGVEIPAEAAAVHGITIEKLRAENALFPDCGIPYIFGSITGRASLRRYPLVIYNACYDWPLLMAECKRVSGLDLRSQPQPFFLDPLVIDRALDKYRKGSRKLEDTARFYGVPLDGAHGAQADAVASVGVMHALIKKYPQLRTFDLPTLQKMQTEWYAEWRDHINEYWEQTGKADRITGDWPTGEAQ